MRKDPIWNVSVLQSTIGTTYTGNQDSFAIDILLGGCHGFGKNITSLEDWAMFYSYHFELWGLHEF